MLKVLKRPLPPFVVYAMLAWTGVRLFAAPAENDGFSPASAARAPQSVALERADPTFPSAVSESEVVELTPVAGSNAVMVAVTVSGRIQVHLAWPFGLVHIPIHSTDSMPVWLEGVQPMRVDAVFDPQSRVGKVLGLKAVGGDVRVSRPLCLTLNLGRYYGIGLGRVDVTVTNLGCRVETVEKHSQSAIDVFPSDGHLLRIDQGVLGCFASGLASGRMDSFSLAFTRTPLQEKLGADDGTAVLSGGTVPGATDRYRISVSTPICFSCPVPVKAPVDVFVTITGTPCWQGTFQRRK